MALWEFWPKLSLQGVVKLQDIFQSSLLPEVQNTFCWYVIVTNPFQGCHKILQQELIQGSCRQINFYYLLEVIVEY